VGRTIHATAPIGLKQYDFRKWFCESISIIVNA